MGMLALNIDMRGKLAVIIGGGAVALRKLRGLQRTGAGIRVVAVKVCPEISALVNQTALTVRVGAYCATDLAGAFLVVAATDDALLNRQICADARERGLLVSVADNPVAGDCTFPALLRRGDLEISVSTGGRCPTFAVTVRDRLAGYIGPEYGAILDQLASEREKLLTNGSTSTYNTQVLRSHAERLLAELSGSKELLP